jgi:hypothetical protein
VLCDEPCVDSRARPRRPSVGLLTDYVTVGHVPRERIAQRMLRDNEPSGRQLRSGAAERREQRVRRSRCRRTRRRGRRLRYGTRCVRAVHRWSTELADLHHVPQRLLRVAQLKLEETKLRLVKTAVEEDEAGGIIQGVAELIAGGNQLAVGPVG